LETDAINFFSPSARFLWVFSVLLAFFFSFSSFGKDSTQRPRGGGGKTDADGDTYLYEATRHQPRIAAPPHHQMGEGGR
jgi:hypothetical protein